MDNRNLIFGLDAKVSLADGRMVPPIYFDNSSTTPPFTAVMDAITTFAPMYANIHGGQYQKALLSEELYEDARNVVLSFLNADHSKDTVIFVKNTTEAINKLSYRFDEQGKSVVVLSTEMEHCSNELPWQNRFTVDYIKVDNNGKLRIEDLEPMLKKHNGAVKLVTVLGVSNVTGYIIPIHQIAEIAHKYNAKIHVDAAQLIPHIPFDMKPHDSPQHIDYATFSAHKMYAPFGIGVLVGPRSTFEKGVPEYQGGSTVKTASLDTVEWENPPHKEEAGTPNIMGIIALAAAIKTISNIDMENIQKYERELLLYLQQGLKSVPDLHMYKDTNKIETIGVIPFNIKQFPHDVLAKALAWEAAVCVRNGDLGAYSYVHRLLETAPDVVENLIANHKPEHPGLIRLSFGLFNTKAEIDIFIDTLSRIAKGKNKYFKQYSR